MHVLRLFSFSRVEVTGLVPCGGVALLVVKTVFNMYYVLVFCVFVLGDFVFSIFV